MKVTIDGKEVIVNDSAKNIVDVADDNNISIPAPCYRVKKKHGPCSGCVIKVNGELKYACATKPTEGMKIIINTQELKGLRKERLLKYKSNIDTGTPNT